MKLSSDGSLTIYIQNQHPEKGKEANWLPASDGEFEMTIRTYWPKPEVNKGEWAPPPVVKVK